MNQSLIALYESTLINTLTGQVYKSELNHEISLCLKNVNLEDSQDVKIFHETSHGAFEHLACVVKGNEVTFKTRSFCLFGIVRDIKNENSSEETDHKADHKQNKAVSQPDQTSPTKPEDIAPTIPETGVPTDPLFWVVLGGLVLIGVGLWFKRKN